MDPFSCDAQDAEQQHLLALSRSLVEPSPMQPANHDHLTVATTSASTDSDKEPPTGSTAASSSSTTGSASQPINGTSSATTNSTSSATGSSFNSIALPSPAIPQKSIGNAPPTPGTFPSSITFPATPATPMTPMAPSSTDPGIVPQLQNIVSTVNLGCKLDLKKIALHARNAEYNPKRFAAVIMRIREPRTTALIFSSGKMVCTGAKSEEQSRLAARKYARIVQKLGFDVS